MTIKKLSFQTLLNVQYYFLVGTVATGILASVVFITHKISSQPAPAPLLMEDQTSLSADLPDRTYNEPLIDTVIVRAVQAQRKTKHKEEPIF